MAKLMEYKCPCCGGAVAFDPGSQKLKCPYCDTEFDIDALKELDDQEGQAKPDQMEWESKGENTWEAEEDQGLRVYVCRSCGGEIICDENTAALNCPYCDNPVIMKGQLEGDLRPDYVIPFQLDKNAAKAAFSSYLKGKKLLPKVFRSENHLDEIKGVYVPFWLFYADAEVDARYRATRVMAWSDSNYNYTRTSHYAVYRSGVIGFERVPVDGSSRMDDDLMESVEPFDFHGAEKFDTAYLSGYLAERYDVTAKQSAGRANERIKTSAQSAFLDTVTGYASVVPDHSSIRFLNSSQNYALYPVWILNTTWRGRHYVFAMNGQTGRFVGDLPIDKGAAARWFLGLTGIVWAVGFALLSLLWML